MPIIMALADLYYKSKDETSWYFCMRRKNKSDNITEMSTFVSKFNIKYFYKNLIYKDISFK